MGTLKIGVMGAGRGSGLAENFILQGCRLVAVCDNRPDRLQNAKNRFGEGVVYCGSFGQFIEQDLDAVILANFFHEHAPYAVECLKRGIHVFSECISNGTMAEGVELIRAAEQSSAVYFLAENYPQMLFNLEMKRVCDGGTLGKVLFAEGEYNHPTAPTDTGFLKTYNYFEKHWRHYLPRAYYITHSLGPVMHITGATPRKVTAFSVFSPLSPEAATASQVGDAATAILTQNDDGSVFRVFGCARFGAHENSYRICGTNGQIENVRGGGNQVLLRYNGWQVPEGLKECQQYEPDWHDRDEELIRSSGHGGGDFITARMFLDCIKKGDVPEHPFNVHAAVAMSSVAILAHRSVMNGGQTYEIPDFHSEDCRKAWENDRESPFYREDGTAPTIPCCSHPDYRAASSQLEHYRSVMTDGKNTSDEVL